MDAGSSWPIWAYLGVATVSFLGAGALYTSTRWGYFVAVGAASVAGFVLLPPPVGGFAIFAVVELLLLGLGFRAAGHHEAIQLVSAGVPWRLKVSLVQAVIGIALIRVFLADLRDDRPRHGPAAGRREHPRAAQLGQGGVRADHVHRRRPQRQVPGVPAGQRAGDRAPPDRDLQPADPHRGPRRGPAAGRLRRAGRVPHPHVGGDRDRRAQVLGHAVHRGPRGGPAALVRRGGRDDRLRRRDEHRAHPADRAHQARDRRGPGGRDAAVRVRPGRGGARDPAQGPRPAGDPARVWRRPAAAVRRGRPRGRRGAPEPGCGCCWSITRTRSCTPWPATSGRRARR